MEDKEKVQVMECVLKLLLIPAGLVLRLVAIVMLTRWFLSGTPFGDFILGLGHVRLYGLSMVFALFTMRLRDCKPEKTGLGERFGYFVIAPCVLMGLGYVLSWFV